MFESKISKLNMLKLDINKLNVESKIKQNDDNSSFKAKDNGNNLSLPNSISEILNDSKNNNTTDIENKINDLKQKKSDNENKIAEKTTEISDFENNIKNSESNIESLNQKLSSLHQPTLSEFQTTYVDKDGKTQTKDNNAAYLKALSEYNQEKLRLEQEIQIEQTKLNQLKSDLNTAKADLQNLTSERNEIDCEISNIESQKDLPNSQDDEEKDDKPSFEQNNKVITDILSSIKKITGEIINSIKEENNKIEDNKLKYTLEEFNNAIKGQNDLSDTDELTNYLNNLESNIDKSEQYSNNNRHTDIFTEIKDDLLNDSVQTSKLRENFIIASLIKSSKVKNSLPNDNSSDDIKKISQNYVTEPNNKYNSEKKSTDKNSKNSSTQWSTGNFVPSKKDVNSSKGKIDVSLNGLSYNPNSVKDDNLERITYKLLSDTSKGVSKSATVGTGVAKVAFVDIAIDQEEKMRGRKLSDNEKEHLNALIIDYVDKIDTDEDGEIKTEVFEKIIDSENIIDTLDDTSVIAEELGEDGLEEIIEDEEASKDLKSVARLAKSGKSASEIITIYHDPVLRANIDSVIQMSEMGMSLNDISEILNNNDLKNNLSTVLQLSKNGMTISDILSILNNPNCKQQLANVLKLSDMGRSTQEIITILNKSNCRKSMPYVIKLVQMGKSSTEIAKTFENPNSILNEKEIVQLSSAGKQSDEINKLNTDVFSLKNIDMAVNLAVKGMNAKDIIGLLNDNNIREVLLNSGMNNNNSSLEQKNSQIINLNLFNKENRNFKMERYETMLEKMKYYNINANNTPLIISNDKGINHTNFGYNEIDFEMFKKQYNFS